MFVFSLHYRNHDTLNEPAMETSQELASQRSMSSQLVAAQAVPTRTCFKRRSCDAALMLECLDTENHMLTSSIEGVLWSDEEETEYFYKEEAASVWSQGEISTAFLTTFSILLSHNCTLGLPGTGNCR